MRSTARVHVRLLGVLGAALLAGTAATTAWAGQPIKAIYIPLADHYAGIVAYEKYRAEMKAADYTIEQMKNWDLLRAYFRTGEVDLAFIICPMAPWSASIRVLQITGRVTSGNSQPVSIRAAARFSSVRLISTKAREAFRSRCRCPSRTTMRPSGF